IAFNQYTPSSGFFYIMSGIVCILIFHVIQVTDYDISAFSCECNSNSFSYPRITAGDDSDLILESSSTFVTVLPMISFGTHGGFSSWKFLFLLRKWRLRIFILRILLLILITACLLFHD